MFNPIPKDIVIAFIRSQSNQMRILNICENKVPMRERWCFSYFYFFLLPFIIYYSSKYRVRPFHIYSKERVKMPDLSHEASAKYWFEYIDPMIYRVITFMESVEDWTLDGNPEFEKAMSN